MIPSVALIRIYVNGELSAQTRQLQLGKLIFQDANIEHGVPMYTRSFRRLSDSQASSTTPASTTAPCPQTKSNASTTSAARSS